MPRYYQVISADGHVETPPEAWVKYVPDKYRVRAPRLIKLQEGGEGWIVEGQPFLHNGQNITGGKTLAPGASESDVMFRNDSYFNKDGSAAPGAGDAAQRLREQDQDGIDAEILFPPVFANRFIEGIADKAAYLSMVQAYNSFLAQDYCSVAPDRLIGSGIMPITGVDDALAELKRVKEMGLRSIYMRQFPNGGGSPDKEDDRFWAKIVEYKMAVSPHSMIGDMAAPPPTAGAGTGSQPFAASLMQRVQGPLYSPAQFIASGVFDRFPTLRIYAAEANAGWLPQALYMIDDSYKLFHKWFDVTLKMLPSEYIKKHYLFSFIRDPMAMRLRDQLPAENLMWGSDFPHSVGSFPNSRGWLEDIFTGVDEKLRRKILLENPAEFIGLDLTKPITETPGVKVAR